MAEQIVKVSTLRTIDPPPARSTYINHAYAIGGEPAHDWHVHTLERLYWAHGYERTVAIAAGQDPATNADLKAWQELGR